MGVAVEKGGSIDTPPVYIGVRNVILRGGARVHVVIEIITTVHGGLAYFPFKLFSPFSRQPIRCVSSQDVPVQDTESRQEKCMISVDEATLSDSRSRMV